MSNASKTTITITSGTKFKAKAFEKVFGEEVVKTKVGWHRKGVVRWSEPKTIEAIRAEIEAEIVEQRRAANLCSSVWNERGWRADPNAEYSALSKVRARYEAAQWPNHGPDDREPIRFGSGRGGMLVAVKLRRDGSVEDFLTLEEWANTHFFSFQVAMYMGFEFLN